MLAFFMCAVFDWVFLIVRVILSRMFLLIGAVSV